MIPFPPTTTLGLFLQSRYSIYYHVVLHTDPTITPVIRGLRGKLEGDVNSQGLLYG